MFSCGTLWFLVLIAAFARLGEHARVQRAEVSGNDRNRDGDGQNAGHGARGTDQPSHRAGWYLVSVTDRHGGKIGRAHV